MSISGYRIDCSDLQVDYSRLQAQNVMASVQQAQELANWASSASDWWASLKVHPVGKVSGALLGLDQARYVGEGMNSVLADSGVAAAAAKLMSPSLWSMQDVGGIANMRGLMSIASAASSMGIADAMSSITERARVATDWRPILTRFMQLPEVAYAASLPEVERSVFAAARPSILDVAQQLRETFDSSALKVFVSWPDASRLSGFFQLGLDHAFDFGFDAPLANGPVVAIPPEAAPTKPKKLPDFVSPLGKQVVVWVAGHPYVVRIISGGTSASIGWMVGEALGSGVLGAWVGGTLHELVVVVIERRRAP